LRLLLMLLLRLLLFRLIGALFRLLLMFLLLVLLEFLPFLILFRDQFVLLLVLLVLLRVARVGCSGPFHRRQVVRMDRIAGFGNISAAITRSIGTPSLSGRHDVAATEFSRPRCRRNRRLAHVHRSPQLRI